MSIRAGDQGELSIGVIGILRLLGAAAVDAGRGVVLLLIDWGVGKNMRRSSWRRDRRHITCRIVGIGDLPLIR